MQFIDQSTDYRKKALRLPQAIADGRAQVVAPDGALDLARCFRPELKTVNDFDKSIDTRLKFDDLSTADKLDLLAAELLPKIFHADQLAKTGKPAWRLRFLIDGTVERVLQIDANGVRPAPSDGEPADVGIETDIVTLMAVLRAAIADYYHNRTIA